MLRQDDVRRRSNLSGGFALVGGRGRLRGVGLGGQRAAVTHAVAVSENNMSLRLGLFYGLSLNSLPKYIEHLYYISVRNRERDCSSLYWFLHVIKDF